MLAISKKKEKEMTIVRVLLISFFIIKNILTERYDAYMKKINDTLKQIFKILVLLVIGGIIYMGIEVLWRGYTHITMGLVGGICFVLMGAINEHFTFKMALVKQMAISAVIVTIVEFIAGVILNIVLKMNVWDYSNLAFNLFGQICLLYTVLWFFLSAVGIILDDYLRNKLFNEPMETYSIFKDK